MILRQVPTTVSTLDTTNSRLLLRTWPLGAEGASGTVLRAEVEEAPEELAIPRTAKGRAQVMLHELGPNIPAAERRSCADFLMLEGSVVLSGIQIEIYFIIKYQAQVISE